MDTMESGRKKNRKHQRVTFSASVRLIRSQEQVAYPLFSGNISHGGMCLEGMAKVKVGDRVALTFSISDESIRVDEAAVVWTRPLDLGASHGYALGMGVQFVTIGQESQKRIGALVDRLLHDCQNRLEVSQKRTA